MENLILKRISYKSLRSTLKNNEELINSTIKSVKNKTTRNRLINEAKQFWAKKFKTSPNKIQFGDLVFYLEKEVPEYVIGNVSVFAPDAETSNLKAVTGRLFSCFVKDFPNLEYVRNLQFDPFYCGKQYVNLPKLKKCQNILLNKNKIKSLALEIVENAELNDTDIDKINIIKAKKLSLKNSTVKDITSLESVNIIDISGIDADKLFINPTLKIKNKSNMIKFFSIDTNV